jgi:hypothetical protein
MRTCGVIGAVVLSVIAVPALIFAILYNGFAQTVLSSPSFMAKLEPANLEAQFQKILPYLVADALTDPDNPDNQEMITQIFPDAGVRGIATEMLPDVLASTNGDLSPAGLETALGANLDTAVTQMVDNAPECTPEAEAELRMAIESKRDIPGQMCRPADDETRTLVIADLSTRMRTAFTPLLDPSQATDLNSTFQSMGDGPASQQEFIDGIELFKAGAIQSLAFPAILLVLIYALAVRTVRSFFAWSGAILITTGLFGLGIAFTSGSILAVDWQALIAEQSTASETQMLLPILDMFYDPVFHVFTAWLTYAYAATAGAGLVGVVVALLIKPPAPPLPNTLSPMPGTPNAIPVMNTGTTNPVATDLRTDTLPVGDVTKPLPASETDLNKTDEHQF